MLESDGTKIQKIMNDSIGGYKMKELLALLAIVIIIGLLAIFVGDIVAQAVSTAPHGDVSTMGSNGLFSQLINWLFS